jgi:hypothetical protein
MSHTQPNRIVAGHWHPTCEDILAAAFPQGSFEHLTLEAILKHGSPEAGIGKPAPVASKRPAPEAGHYAPARAAGSRFPAPDLGIHHPAPQAGHYNPAPQAGIRNPTPEAGNYHPAPVAGTRAV